MIKGKVIEIEIPQNGFTSICDIEDKPISLAGAILRSFSNLEAAKEASVLPKD